METVTICATINEKKKNEFYQTMESLTTLVKNYCNEIDYEIIQDNKLIIRITFDSKEDLGKNFYNNEFNILKGSVRSVCDNRNINIT